MDPISLGLGALTFGTQAFSSILGFNNQAAATRAQNKQALKIYKHQMQQQKRDYIFRTNAYRGRIDQFRDQVDYNQTAAGRAYMAEQSRLNELYKQMGFEQQGAQSKLQEGLGQIQARGVRGKTSQRMQALMLGDFGRNQAIRQEQYNTAVQNLKQRNLRTADQLKIANKQAYYAVGQEPMEPIFGPAPMMQQGPSQMGLFADLGQAALSGYGAYQKYQTYDPGAK